MSSTAIVFDAPRNCGAPESPMQGLPSLIIDRCKIVLVRELKDSVVSLRVPAELRSMSGGPSPMISLEIP